MKRRRQLSQDYRIQHDSLPEVKFAWERLCFEWADDGWKVDGWKLKPGPALNAVLLEFMALPDADREAFLRRGIGRLETLKATALETETAGGEAPAAESIDIKVTEVPGEGLPKRAPRKRKKGG